MSVKHFKASTFHRCVDRVDQLESADAEVVFVGRSNAGKSSLVNSLCANGKLAKISKIPGKTRTINVFSLIEGKWLVDLPGYGYAKVAKAERNTWRYMIEKYFAARNSLKAVFVLVDAKVGATKLDLQMLEWLEQSNHLYYVIVNKVDKISAGKLDTLQAKLSEELGLEREYIFGHSNKKSTGVQELQKCIAKLLEI